MHRIHRYRLGAAALAVVIVAGCGQVGQGSGHGSGFALDYANARTALEEGNYSRAARLYKRLVSKSGPLEPRIRIELAHALLRDDAFADAAFEARAVAAVTDGDARTAALAVAGTAEHRIGEVAMAKGSFGPAEMTVLRTAKAALDEVLTTAPEFDPLGGLAERRQMIADTLARYGG